MVCREGLRSRACPRRPGAREGNARQLGVRPCGCVAIASFAGKLGLCVAASVLIVSRPSVLPYPVAPTERFHDIGRKFDVLFSRLMKRFEDVQFFGSYRVVSFAAWARAQNGEPKRVFAYADSEVLANVGEQTLEEAKLKFANLRGLSPSAASDRIGEIAEQQEAEEDTLVARGLSRHEASTRIGQNGLRTFPDEKDVVELAALWSVDPRQLSNQDHPLELGLAARLPESLTQRPGGLVP